MSLKINKEVAAKRKPRRSYNCGPCKKHKIKCDTQIPCYNCVKHNRIDQCLEQPPNPPLQDYRKRARRETLSSFNARPDSNSAINSLQSVPFVNSVNSVTAIKLPSIRSFTSKFNSNDNLNNLNLLPRDAEVVQLRSQVKLLTERLNLLETKVLGQKSGQIMSPTQHHKPLNKIAPENIYSFHDCIGSLRRIQPLGKIGEFYKLFLNQPLNIIDDELVDTAYKRLDELSLEPLHHPTTKDWEFLSLFAIITSLSLLQYPLKYVVSDFQIEKNLIVTTADTFFQISKSALNTIKYREQPKIAHLNVLLLFDVYLRLFNKRNLMLALDSELVSMSYVMGLQKLPIPENSLEVHTAQNAWWVIIHLDTLKSLKFKTPPLIRLYKLPKFKDVGNDSHILKAFISIENKSYQKIITHIAKITKICNEISSSIQNSTLEYIETLIMCDRQITSYQIPDFFQKSKDINVIFQDCYLQFFIIITRFRIYEKILFEIEKIPNFKLKHSILFLILSISESFLKKYCLLRSSFPIKEYFNHYIQISEFLITGAIINLILTSSPDFKIHPKRYQNVVSKYTKTLFEDLTAFHETIFNETIPFYSQSFKLMRTLIQHRSIPELELSMKQKQLELNNELQSSSILQSLESKIGLIPSDEFCNLFITEIINCSRGNKNEMITPEPERWNHLSFLNNEQSKFVEVLGI